MGVTSPVDQPAVADPAVSEKVVEPTLTSSVDVGGRKSTIVFFDESEAQGECKLDSAFDCAPPPELFADNEEGHIDANAMDNIASSIREGRSDISFAADALERGAKRIREMKEENAKKTKLAEHYGKVISMMQMVMSSVNETGISNLPNAEPVEEQKNYMVKRGDAPSPKAEKPKERVVVERAPQALANTVSRDEMEQQKNDRLARLEKMQESARKEREESERKAKAREAMFDPISCAGTRGKK